MDGAIVWKFFTGLKEMVLTKNSYKIDDINSKVQIQWYYVNSDENPAGIGSRGYNIDKSPKKWL